MQQIIEPSELINKEDRKPLSLPFSADFPEDHYNIFAYALKVCFCCDAMNEIIYKWYHNGTYLSVNTFSSHEWCNWNILCNVEQGIRTHIRRTMTQNQVNSNPHAVCNYCVLLPILPSLVLPTFNEMCNFLVPTPDAGRQIPCRLGVLLRNIFTLFCAQKCTWFPRRSFKAMATRYKLQPEWENKCQPVGFAQRSTYKQRQPFD